MAPERDALHLPGGADPGPRVRLEQVSSGIDALARRVASASARPIDLDERAVLTTLLVSLSDMLAGIEQELSSDPSLDADLRREVREERARLEVEQGNLFLVAAEQRREQRKAQSSGAIVVAPVVVGPTARPAPAGPAPTDLGGVSGRTMPPGSEGASFVAKPKSKPKAQRTSARRTTGFIGKILVWSAAYIALFLIFLFGISAITQARTQRALLYEFANEMPTGTVGELSASTTPGDPVAMLQFPKFTKREVVVEGSNPEQLESGPGHLPSSPLPGEFGNSVIIGHRSTWGSPFGQLNHLVPGDVIVVTTGQGVFRYDVQTVSVVQPGDPDALGSSLDSRLTLVTSTALSSTERLAVTATLEGDPLGIPARPIPQLAADEQGSSGTPLALVFALGWAVLLAAAIYVTRRLYRHWPVVATYLVSTPILLFLCWMSFENLARLLPGTL